MGLAEDSERDTVALESGPPVKASSVAVPGGEAHDLDRTATLGPARAPSADISNTILNSPYEGLP